MDTMATSTEKRGDVTEHTFETRTSGATRRRLADDPTLDAFAEYVSEHSNQEAFTATVKRLAKAPFDPTWPSVEKLAWLFVADLGTMPDGDRRQALALVRAAATRKKAA
jgi:hypothetical protein